MYGEQAGQQSTVPVLLVNICGENVADVPTPLQMWCDGGDTRLLGSSSGFALEVNQLLGSEKLYYAPVMI